MLHQITDHHTPFIEALVESLSFDEFKIKYLERILAQAESQHFQITLMELNHNPGPVDNLPIIKGVLEETIGKLRESLNQVHLQKESTNG